MQSMPGLPENPATRFSVTSHTCHQDANPRQYVAFEDCEQCTEYPNRWSRIRALIREPAAEFLGTMILVIFGCGANCQAVLSSNIVVSATPRGDSLSISFGWAVGLSLGVWASYSISGGHINPAVTLAFASARNFPWKKVPFYILAQLLGAICGAGIVYAHFYNAINLYEGGSGIRTISGTGHLFGTYPAGYMSPVACFFAEFLASAMLIIMIFAVTDKRNCPSPPALVPVALFITTLGIGLALGMQTGGAINPARDLGSRILTAMVGYGGAVFSFRNQYWIWCPVLAPILGMQIAAFTYDAFVYTGADSIVNKPRRGAESGHANERTRRKMVLNDGRRRSIPVTFLQLLETL